MRDLRNAVGETNSLPILGAPLMGGVSLPLFLRYCSGYLPTGELSADPWEDWKEDPLLRDWETVASAIGPDTMPTCAIGHYGDLGVMRGVLPVPQLLSEQGIMVLLPTHPDSTTSILEPDTIADCLEQIADYIRAGGMLPSLVDGTEGGK